MAFPEDLLDVRIDLQIAGVWTDSTADALTRDPITITRGRADEASDVDPSTCSLTLRNPDGKYSPRNPMSPYFGALGRNTPLRVGVGVPPAGAGLAGQSGTSVVAPSVTAETAGALFGVWAAAPVGNITGPGGFTMGTERDGALSTWAAGHKTVSAGATGTSTATHSLSATAAAGLSVFVPGTAMTIAGFSAILDDGDGFTLSVTGVTAGDHLLAVVGWSSDPADALISAPADSDGVCRWILVADSGPSTGPRMRAYIREVTTAGTFNVGIWGAHHGKPDVYGRVWRITGATGWDQRFAGEVSTWPPRWDRADVDVHSPITASGVLRRLGQGDAPLRSALRRELLSYPSLRAYWPMEDGAGSVTFASAVGGPAMTRIGNPVAAADDGFACSDPLPTFTGAGARGTVPPYASTGLYIVGALLSVPAAGNTDESTLLTISTTGTTGVGVGKWTIKLDSSGASLRIMAHDQDNFELHNQTLTPAVSPLGARFFMYLVVTQNGSDADYELFYVPLVPGVDAPEAYFHAGTIVVVSSGRPSVVTVGAAGDLTGAPTIGHVVVLSAVGELLGAGTRALTGYNGENARRRFSRLCQEESVPAYVQTQAPSGTPESALLGPQRTLPLLELLREIAAADGGLMYEPRGFVGLGYRTRASYYQAEPVLELDYSAAQVHAPFEPVDDDQGVVNDVTVTRPAGSSARQTLDAGALSTQPPPHGVGRYDTDVEINVHTDADLPDQAGWRLHLGTWDEARYPSVRVNLAGSPELITAATDLDVGDRVTISDLPAWLPPGDADLIAQGFSETLSRAGIWDITANTTPAGPWRVPLLDSTTLGRLDSLTSTLAEDLDTTETAVDVATTAGPLWTTTATRPSDFPFDVTVGGEEMTVTAISGTTSPQTFTVTRSTNGVVKTHTSGAQIRLARPVTVAL